MGGAGALNHRKAPLGGGLALAAGWALVGCATIGDDLSNLGEALMPMTPYQAGLLMVDPHDPDNRRRGTVLIANSPFGGTDAYVAVYRDRTLHERNPLAKAASIRALGRYGEPDDAPAIAASLEADNFQVRWESAKALQRIHNPAVIPALVAVFRRKDEHPDILVAAASALGQYPQDRVFQALLGALDAPELAVNVAARRSLQTLTGEDLGPDPTDWLRWYNSTEKPFAGRLEYHYPTYQRQRSWLEKLAFWSSKPFEEPAVPAGLRPSSQRRTYQDQDEPKPDETGG